VRRLASFGAAKFAAMDRREQDTHVGPVSGGPSDVVAGLRQSSASSNCS